MMTPRRSVAASVRGSCGTGGFALVVVLAILAMVLVLVLSVSSVMHVETRASGSLRELNQARQNALLGLEIAVGQLQEHAGKDQAVTFPATTFYPMKNTGNGTGPLYDDPTFGYRSLASVSRTKTYLTPSERNQWEARLRGWWSGKNPRWTGVGNASLRRDGTPSDKFGEPKRDQLPVWLVSGNEKLNFSSNASSYPPGYQTPDTALPAPADPNDLEAPIERRMVVQLVGNGSATPAADSSDGLNGHVVARKQEIKGSGNRTLGHYAYWVGDESAKANFAVRDPFESATSPSSEEYRNRLQVPQRIGWEMVSGFGNASFSPNDARLGWLSTSREISLLETDPARVAEVMAAARRNFHHLTAFSRGLLTDTALGGLRRDLTPLLHGSPGDYNLTAPIADTARYAANDPRFSPGGGFPASVSNIPTWGDLRAWAQTSAGPAVAPGPGRAPVLVSYRLFFAMTHRDGRLQMHFVPCFVLWNPLDVPLLDTGYTLSFRHNFQMWRFGVATRGITDPTPTNFNDGQYWPDGNATAGNSTFYLHQLEPVDWFDRRNPNFKRFGMGGNTFSFINDSNQFNPPADGSFPRYRMAPFDNFPSGNPASNPPLPFGGAFSSNVTFVRYQFAGGFAPGEVKVFMVQGHQQVAAAQLHSGTPVQLVNDYDPDFPGSLYFDYARFRDVDGTGATVPTSGSETVFYAEMLLSGINDINTPMFNSAELRTAAGELWRAETLGHHPNWGANFRLQWTPLQIEANAPQNWRRVYHFDDWTNRAKAGSTGNRNSALVAMYRAFLEPFAVPAWRIYSDWQNRLSIDGASRYSRGFANFNLSSPVFELPPEFERSRAVDSTNNTDLYTTLSLMQTVTDATANPAEFMRWDAGQADTSSGVARGFALISSRVTDALGNRGLSLLPLRQYGRPPGDVLSIGRLQQAPLSRFAWQPTFPTGNAEASPYVDRARISGVTSYTVGTSTSASHISVPQWLLPAGTRQNSPENRLVDLSYLLNENLWDSYFLSSVPQVGSIPTDNSTPLPNSRHRFSPRVSLTQAELRSANQAAAGLENLGALNVNSTSAEAWKALLSSFRNLTFATNDSRNPAERSASIPVSRTLDPQGGPIRFTFQTQNANDIGAAPTSQRDYSKLFDGFRYLTDDMISALANRIVDEVRLRGPFYSVADFVNRRLVAPQGANVTTSDWRRTRERNRSGHTGDSVHSYGVPTNFYGGGYTDTILPNYDPFPGLAGLNGALQRAINLSGINGGLNFPSPLPNDNRSFRVEVNPRLLAPNPQVTGNQPMQIHPHAGQYLDTEHLAGAPTGEVGQLLSHAPGFVTQGDILAMIGPALTARGDTFVVRSYGDAVNPAGRVVARAWLEAVVQRVIEPVKAAGSSGADRWRPADGFGRKFRVLSVRWLSPEDV